MSSPVENVKFFLKENVKFCGNPHDIRRRERRLARHTSACNQYRTTDAISAARPRRSNGWERHPLNPSTHPLVNKYRPHNASRRRRHLFAHCLSLPLIFYQQLVSLFCGELVSPWIFQSPFCNRLLACAHLRFFSPIQLEVVFVSHVYLWERRRVDADDDLHILLKEQKLAFRSKPCCSTSMTLMHLFSPLLEKIFAWLSLVFFVVFVRGS